ncbi:MAG: alpha-E domain-containing protein, partial [Myxococcales bacterium]|nr:alpha-E domain-containing protein [Myxococcales bacterium]
VNLNLMLDLPGHDPVAQWAPVVATTGDAELFGARYGQATEGSAVRFLTFDEDNANSILRCVSQARDNARSVRDAISTELWEDLNAFYLDLKESARAGDLAPSPSAFFARIRRGSHLVKGVIDSTMSRTEGWHFARLGRLIERADQTSRILDVKYYMLLPRVEDVGGAIDEIQWAALLKSASALEMYRKRFGLIRPEHVADFLIFDRHFPRAIHYCLVDAEASVHAITGSPWGTYRNEPEQLLGRLRSELDYTRVDEVTTRGLHEFLDDLQLRLNQIDDAISKAFFSLPSEV